MDTGVGHNDTGTSAKMKAPCNIVHIYSKSNTVRCSAGSVHLLAEPKIEARV